jgi:hypothetical protein
MSKHVETQETNDVLKTNTTEPNISADDDVIELGDNFDFDGFQVVRREFFAHIREPSISFNSCKFSVNTACISKFPETEYVQVLVNKDEKVLALRPCEEGARDSFAWCLCSGGKRKPRAITGKIFFAKIVSLMNWNPDYRYKMLGRVIHANGEYLLAFDLTSTEVYQRTFKEGEKPKTSRTPIFPESWKEQFGLPFNEHQQSMQINIFDGYAIYAIKDNSPSEKKTTPILDVDSLPGTPVSNTETLLLGADTQ